MAQNGAAIEQEDRAFAEQRLQHGVVAAGEQDVGIAGEDVANRLGVLNITAGGEPARRSVKVSP